MQAAKTGPTSSNAARISRSGIDALEVLDGGAEMDCEEMYTKTDFNILLCLRFFEPDPELNSYSSGIFFVPGAKPSTEGIPHHDTIEKQV